MKKRKNILKIAIDSPAAAGAGTLAKTISEHYNLFYLDTGKIYRYIAYLKVKYPKKFRETILNSISNLTSLNINQINLKGKTVEKLGLIGKEKAIACEVITSITKYE